MAVLALLISFSSAAFVPATFKSHHGVFRTELLSEKNDSNSEVMRMNLPKWLQKSFIVPMMIAGSFALQQPDAAFADNSRTIAEISGSGLVFKDTLVVESFDDPKVQGVSLYVSNFQRPLAERLTKGFFEDPSSAAVSCAKTGKVRIADNINTSKQGEVRILVFI